MLRVFFSKSFPAKLVFSSLPLHWPKMTSATFPLLLCFVGVLEKQFWTFTTSVLFISVKMVSSVLWDLFLHTFKVNFEKL